MQTERQKMNTTTQPQSAAMLAGGLAVLALTVAFLVLARPVQAACGGTTSVANTTQLNDAITLFNSQTSACDSGIRLASDITLSADVIEVDNSVANVELTIDGNGFTINGLNLYQTLVISAGVAALNNVTVTQSSDAGLEVRSSASVSMTASVVTSNTQGYGGIRNEGALDLADSTVSDNVNTDDGGGIANYGTLSVDGSTIDGNAGNNGGGIFNAGTLTLRESVVSNNDAEYSGGIDNQGMMTVVDSQIADNTTTNDGGIYNDQAVLQISRSTINGNSAVDGGGIYNDDGTLAVVNSTVAENEAVNNGGGVENIAGSLTMTNSTVSGNTAARGGGIYNSATLVMANSIAANSGGGDCVDDNGAVSGWHSLFEDSGSACGLSGGTDGVIVGADPLLGPLANSGGPTPVMALLAGSPAINGGSNSRAVDGQGNALATDQRGVGFARILNTTVDLGAYEFDTTPLAVTLGWFTSLRTGDRVDFHWQTAAATNVAGFNVLAEAAAGRERLNAALIPSTVIDAATPVDYRFSAVTAAEAFTLEEVRLNGDVIEHGPFELGRAYGAYTPADADKAAPSIWLPIIVR